MKKYLFLIITVFCFTSTIVAQNDKNWEVSSTYAYQFRLNEFNDTVFSSNQDLHQYGLSFKRVILNKKGFQLLSGIGYSRQQILGYVGVNHCYPGGDICPFYYAMTKNYAIQLAEVPIELRFHINDKFGIDLSITPQFRFHQNDDYNFQSRFLFDINSVEIYPAVSYQIEDFRFSFGGRLMNWQMFDRLFYYYDYPDNNPDFYEQTLYRYNPLKLRLTASYIF